MKFDELYALQLAQQEDIHGRADALPPETLRVLAHKFAVSAAGELHDYLAAAAFGWRGAPAPRNARLVELIDALKFLLAAAWAEGFDADEIERAFVSRTMVVSARWAQRDIRGARAAALDLDGVIATGWPDDPAREDIFIEGAGALGLEPVPGAVETLNALREEGWVIIIVTARKAHIHRRLEADTREWLARHNIPHDAVLFSWDKADALARTGASIAFAVDDSPKHALDLAGVATVSYLFGADGDVKLPGVVAVSDWKKLREDLLARGYLICSRAGRNS